MYVFERFLGRYHLTPVIGTLSLVAVLLIVPHFFIDILLATSYKHAQSDFQRFYLCVHWAVTMLAMCVLIYGFWALSNRSYHAISNFRSWTLCVGLSLFFSGFFSVIGFALDWHLFRAQCLRDFEHIRRHDVAGLNVFVDEKDCRDIYYALLVVHSVLWALTETTLMLLFLNINSYKVTNYAEEERRSQEKRQRELSERNRRMGVRETEKEDDDNEQEDVLSGEHCYHDDLDDVFACMTPEEHFVNGAHRSIRFAPLPTPRSSFSHPPQRRSTLPSIAITEPEPEPQLSRYASLPVAQDTPTLPPISHNRGGLGSLERMFTPPTIYIESPNGTPQTFQIFPQRIVQQGRAW